ncbi:hypothetical protein A1Q2_07965 [Trichosporon asahii var. asahii CBS 8904]|uniref:Uncharacterized protein n=1 Tax=Trichosporon asahii var. asahii (strain CBS 8904) TaxID=1220162 RepID=K1VFB5_TRIAC|nr:hypothetical protein A1Q2_07965 [Trichosporon asahii var. asahii CBS 8904]
MNAPGSSATASAASLGQSATGAEEESLRLLLNLTSLSVDTFTSIVHSQADTSLNFFARYILGDATRVARILKGNPSPVNDQLVQTISNELETPRANGLNDIPDTLPLLWPVVAEKVGSVKSCLSSTLGRETTDDAILALIYGEPLTTRTTQLDAIRAQQGWANAPDEEISAASRLARLALLTTLGLCDQTHVQSEAGPLATLANLIDQPICERKHVLDNEAPGPLRMVHVFFSARFRCTDWEQGKGQPPFNCTAPCAHNKALHAWYKYDIDLAQKLFAAECKKRDLTEEEGWRVVRLSYLPWLRINERVVDPRPVGKSPEVITMDFMLSLVSALRRAGRGLGEAEAIWEELVQVLDGSSTLTVFQIDGEGETEETLGDIGTNSWADEFSDELQKLIKGKEASGGLLNPVEVDAFFPHHCLKAIIDRVNAHSEL